MWDGIGISARDALGIGAAIYLLACLLGSAALAGKRRYPRPMMLALMGGGFAFQTLGLNLRGAAIQACPLGNLFEVAQFIAWSLVLLYFLIGPIFRVSLLGFFTALLATFLSGGVFLIPGADAPYPPGLFGGDPWIELHAALAIFSYGMFGVLALVSVMFLIQQHGLKHKRFNGIYTYLPSVRQLDSMAQRLAPLGCGALSLALGVGAAHWLRNPDSVPAFKLSVTTLVWCGYASLVALRARKKLVTRRHAIAAIALFGFAMLSLWPVETARDAQPREPDQAAERAATAPSRIPRSAA